MSSNNKSLIVADEDLEEEDEDKVILFPDLTQDAVRAEVEEIQKLEESLKKARERKQKLGASLSKVRADIVSYQMAYQGGLMQLERMRALKMSIIWLILMAITSVYAYGCFDKGWYFLMIFNEFARFLVYRGLFLPTNKAHYGWAMFIVFWTAVYMHYF